MYDNSNRKYFTAYILRGEPNAISPIYIFDDPSLKIVILLVLSR